MNRKLRHRWLGIPMQNAVLIALVVGLLLVSPATAQDIDPRASGVCELPELGRMRGTLESKVGDIGEGLGLEINGVGDLDGDGLSDWTVLRRRVDTPGFGRIAEELLVYYGVRGGLPRYEDGLRLGPAEIGSRTRFLSSGDFDADGHRDAVVALECYGDTTGGKGGYDRFRIVVFWGSATGKLTLQDTTQLENVSPVWLRVTSGLAADFDADGVDDLLLRAGHTLIDGQLTYTAFTHLYRGTRNGRWGRGDRPRSAHWQWWSIPRANDIAVVDHDGDGALDVAMIYNDVASVSAVSVLYGRRGALPDTTDVETVPLAIANGRQSRFVDLTGDRVPELVVAAGSQEKLKVFIGIRGQRLFEQYGTGYDAPRPGEQKWWGRPWAEIWLPKKLSAGWNMAGFDPFFPLGDVGLDGTADICVHAHPWIGCYNGGRMLDSLLDALIYVPGYGIRGVAAVGDIDGSGVASIAVSYADLLPGSRLAGPGGIRYVKASRCVPTGGRARMLPAGTDRPASTEPSPGIPSLALTISPNPARTDATVRWPRQHGVARLSIADTRGAELRRWSVPASAGELDLDLDGWPRGLYLLSFSAGDLTGTRSLVLE